MGMAKTENMDIEIRDNNVDVKKIMKRLKESIQRGKEEKKTVEVEHLERKTDARQPSYTLHPDLGFINANWDIENKAYRISSHRKVLGPVLVKGRELIYGELRRYIDPVFWKQKEFNSSVVRLLNYLSKEPREIKEQSNEDIDLNYFKFENKFRGSESSIKTRQRAYVKYFKSKKNVLDVGCGRGEFLELLKENGIQAKGVDVNENMVKYCKKKDLDVEKIDAIDYLSSLENCSLEGIFASQVIEHLKPKYVVKLIRLAHKKLKPNCYIIIETINPTSFISLSNFNLDPSHTIPIHPYLMKFILTSVGFKQVKVQFLSPILKKSKLALIEMSNQMSEYEKKTISIHNKNAQLLNTILFGYQDYSAVAKR